MRRKFSIHSGQEQVARCASSSAVRIPTRTASDRVADRRAVGIVTTAEPRPTTATTWCTTVTAEEAAQDRLRRRSRRSAASSVTSRCRTFTRAPGAGPPCRLEPRPSRPRGNSSGKPLSRPEAVPTARRDPITRTGASTGIRCITGGEPGVCCLFNVYIARIVFFLNFGIYTEVHYLYDWWLIGISDL